MQGQGGNPLPYFLGETRRGYWFAGLKEQPGRKGGWPGLPGHKKACFFYCNA